MMTHTHGTFSAVLAASLLTLAGCGGGGGGGGPSEAAIDATNAQALGVAAAQAAQQAVTTTTTPIPGAPFAPAIGAPVASAVSQGVNLCDSGSLSTSGSNPVTIDYNQCDFGGVVLDGRVRFSFSDDFDRISVQYSNFTSSFMGDVVDFGGYGYTCTGLQGGIPACNFDFGDFTSVITGIEYDVDDIEVDGDEISGFVVGGSVADPAFGQVDFDTVENLFFDECEFGVPEEGLIDLLGAEDTEGSVEFIDCDTFEVCFDDGLGGGEICLPAVDWSIFDTD